MKLDLFRNSIGLLKSSFLASLRQNFSTVCLHTLSKFCRKSAQKCPIFSTQASFERGLLKKFLLLGLSGSLFAAGPYVKQPELPYFEQGTPLREGQFPAAYNAPARPSFQRGWNFFLTGSYLYWLAEQEGMEVAISTNAVMDLQAQTPTISFTSQDAASFHRADFRFSPGYKAALGFSCDQVDHWIGSLEYTWMHQKAGPTELSKDVLLLTPSSSSAEFLSLTSWFTSSRGFFPLPAWSVKAKWRMDLDMGDAYIGRPYYQGRFLTFTPLAGVRGLWICQNFRLKAHLPKIPNLLTPSEPLVSRNYSHSWAVGPRLGFLGRWLLGWGFRLEGDASGALLFTRYTKVSHRESETVTLPSGSISESTHIAFRDYNTVRPMLNAGLGFGWGGYLGACRDPFLFVDLSVNYDFLQFWGQNMMGKLVNDYYSGMDTQASDLHMQGITASLRIDF